MPIARFQMPDGQIGRFEVPEGTTPEQAQAAIAAVLANSSKRPSAAEQIANDPITKGAQAAQATPAELISANPMTRVLTSAARPVLGAASLIEGLWGGTSGRERLKQLDEMQARGNQALFPDVPVTGAVADVAGSMVSPVMGVATKMAPAATYAGKIAQGAQLGGLAGVTAGGENPVADAGLGLTIGAVVPAVLSGPGALVSGVRTLKDKIFPTPGALGVKAAGDRSDEVIAALRSAQSNVPGVNLTSGQASVPANSAEFAALQRLVSEGKDPSRYFGPAGIEGEQQAARRASVQTIGKTPADLQAAILARKTASDSNYMQAFGTQIGRDKELRELWKNPYFRDEVGEAWKLAKSKGLSPTKDLTEFLHFVKEGMDARLQTLNNPTAPAISNSTKKAIADAKDALVTWLGKKNPAYEAARLEHARLSKPINQMKVGQEIEQALVAPGTEAERVSAFSSAVRKAENTISKASGKPRIDDLTAAQRGLFDAIEEDFKRNAEYAALASKGGKNLEARIGAPQAPPTGWFQPIVSAARSWANRLLGSGHEKALERLAPIMENPAAMAKAMHDATPQQKVYLKALRTEWIARAGTVATTSNQRQGD